MLIAGLVAAALGKAFLGGSDSLAATFCEAVAGGAVLALITHAIIPEALHQGGSLIVLVVRVPRHHAHLSDWPITATSRS